MKASLVLLEIVNTDRLRIYRNEYYPFIQGLVRSLGVPCRWISLGVEARTAATGANLYLYEPSTHGLEAAAAALAEVPATHVLLNERLEETAFSRLRTAVPKARFHMLQMSPSGPILEHLEVWLGLDLRELRAAGRMLEDGVRPDFERIPLNDLAISIRPHPSLLLGPGCDYVRSLDGHPDFGTVDRSTRSHRGCSFCVNPDPDAFRPGTDPVVLAMEQLAGAAETLDPGLQDRSFLVRGVNLLPRIEDLAAALEDAGTPPTVFFVSTRVDRILRLEDRLRRALPILERRGHRLHIWNMGIENHSPRENERLNKGLSPEVLRAGVSALLRLTDEFPDGIDFDGWGYILYTPWTTPDDLRINLGELSQLGSTNIGFALGTALQLLPGLPVTRLAEADGLLVDVFEDLPTDSGCVTTWDGFEVPWRFLDPRSARMYSLTRRFLPRGVIPDDDLLLGVVRDWLGSLPNEARNDTGAVAGALLDVLGETTPVPDIYEHLEAARHLLEVRFPSAEAAPAPPPEGSPEQNRLLAALRADEAAGALPVGALRVDAIRLRSTDDGGRVEVVLVGGPAPLEVLLERTPEDAPAFLRSGPLALSYKSRAPGPTDLELTVLRALLEHAAVLARTG
ncbi:MAG: hypothetical protein ABIK09_15905 [Pseudomonadota bacterium]